MTNRNAMFAKRQRELKQQEKAREKERRKAERGKVGGADAPDGVDPDIAGIVPGPQPKDPALAGDEPAEGEGEAEATPAAAEKK